MLDKKWASFTVPMANRHSDSSDNEVQEVPLTTVLRPAACFDDVDVFLCLILQEENL